jgi:hypothetical protein
MPHTLISPTFSWDCPFKRKKGLQLFGINLFRAPPTTTSGVISYLEISSSLLLLSHFLFPFSLISLYLHAHPSNIFPLEVIMSGYNSSMVEHSPWGRRHVDSRYKISMETLLNAFNIDKPNLNQLLMPNGALFVSSEHLIKYKSAGQAMYTCC